MTGRVRTVAALAIAQAMCAGPGAALAQQVYENSGHVCFETTSDGATTAEYRLDGCFNSSCTTMPETSLVATVTESPPVVRLRMRMVMAGIGAGSCTADCGGMPPVAFDLGVVPAGSYEVFLGDVLIGTWVPVPGAEPACVPVP